jgi:hypothetical protein
MPTLPPRIRRVAGLVALLLPASQLHGQQCPPPGATTGVAARLAGGLEWGGNGSARGATVALHGHRWFVLGEYTDRGWALGRRTFQDSPFPGYMERQHQVLGARAGVVRALGTRTSLCVSGGYAAGTGLWYRYSGEPELGGVGFESHRRVRADLALAHAVTGRGMRLQPGMNVGVLFVRERELQGDIVSDGLTGALPISFTLGVPLGDAFTVRPRANLGRGSQAGASYGVDAVVQLGRARR